MSVPWQPALMACIAKAQHFAEHMPDEAAGMVRATAADAAEYGIDLDNPAEVRAYLAGSIAAAAVIHDGWRPGEVPVLLAVGVLDHLPPEARA